MTDIYLDLGVLLAAVVAAESVIVEQTLVDSSQVEEEAVFANLSSTKANEAEERA